MPDRRTYFCAAHKKVPDCLVRDAQQESLFYAAHKRVPRGVTSRKKVNFLSIRFLPWLNLRSKSVKYTKIK